MAEIREIAGLRASLSATWAQPRQPVETLPRPGSGAHRDSSNMAVKGVVQGALALAFQCLVHGVSLGGVLPVFLGFRAGKLAFLPVVRVP